MVRPAGERRDRAAGQGSGPNLSIRRGVNVLSSPLSVLPSDKGEGNISVMALLY